MHVPDGFLNVPTSVGTGLIAVAAIGICLKRADSKQVGPALPGLVAAFVFAAQMINFPVGAGTSGHLIGGALAAVLVGPWLATLVLTTVLLVQALLFADGGITALGTNVVLMAILAVWTGYAVAWLVHRWGPQNRATIVLAVALGGLVSVPVAALGFVALYLVGGAVPISPPALSSAMVGWHAIIGVGEALISAAVVSAVVASRPDLVYLGRSGEPEPLGIPVAGGFLAAATALAGGLCLFASAHPDGLEYVAGLLGFDEAALDSWTAGSPLADYSVAALGDYGTILAGLIGMFATLALAWGVTQATKPGPVA